MEEVRDVIEEEVKRRAWKDVVMGPCFPFPRGGDIVGRSMEVRRGEVSIGKVGELSRRVLEEVMGE